MEYASGIIFLAFVVFWVINYRERREWNNGVCRKSGKKWVQIDHEILENKRHRFTYSDGCGNVITRAFADEFVNR